MNRRIIILSLSFLTLGCEEISPWISNTLWNNRLDADQDGIPRPDDCDDRDPNVGIRIWYRDVDKDGFGAGEKIIACDQPLGTTITSNDCDDTHFNVHPGATEICDYLDNNCNGLTDELVENIYYKDADTDLFGNVTETVSACTAPDGYVTDHTDCDDTLTSVHPGAVETCNNIDDNCNGTTDEGVTTLFYADADQDGYGNLSAEITACSAPNSFILNHTDCDDSHATVHPGATEICDGLDNNCNNETDEGLVSTYYQDADEDGYGNTLNSITSCAEPVGYVLDSTDCNDLEKKSHPNATEVCDGIDNDCNGLTDEGLTSVYYIDADNDGYGNVLNSITACTKPIGYVSDDTDCNDLEKKAHPNATEVCDGLDNDCNGLTDEGLILTFYADADQDGYGNLSAEITACSAPNGFILNHTDCDDGHASVHPGATEICDGLDNNCNGATDEGLMSMSYQDADNDGYGNNLVSITTCTKPIGYVSDNTDCDDLEKKAHPNAIEACDGIDNNCNGQTDEGVTSVFYQDADQDTYGNLSVEITACVMPVGYVTDHTDCNDTSALTHPNGTEVCDGLDNDCNGKTDEPTAIDAKTWYADSDQDGFGSALNLKVACVKPFGFTDNKLDCNDSTASISPISQEVCNGLDDNCNGETDEGVQTIFFADVDQDGYGNALVIQSACVQPSGYVSNDVDCNDLDKQIHPNKIETCNGIDDNCNGETDEGVLLTFFVDADQDGYGNILQNVLACTAPNGYVANSADCDDGNKSVHPNAIEVCDNNIDENCDGITDNALEATLWYEDADQDGYGNSAVTKFACMSPTGFVANATDCNDASNLIHPNATELCNDSIDNNCNGITDSDAKIITWYIDADQDGFGSSAQTKQNCAKPVGYVENATDCNDANASIHPGVTEVCNNGLDDNCDGSADQCFLNPVTDMASGDVLLTGEKNGDMAGFSTASGDLNYDGVADILIGAPQNSEGGVGAGAVYIFFGPLTSSTSNLNKANVKLVGEAVNDNAGWSLSASDVNNDGKDDVIIGAPQNAAGGTNAGATYIFFGPLTSGSFNLSKANVKLVGEASGDNAGWSIASKSDLNNDGKLDVVIGAYHNNAGGLSAGAVYVFFGPLTSGTFNLNKANVKLVGEASGDNAGWTVASVGDVNNDQIDDILIGAYRNDAGGTDAGAAYVLFGPLAAGTVNLNTSNAKFTGEAGSDFAGFSVQSAGDINHDGHLDILIGAIYQDAGGANAGATYILFGPLTSGTFNLNKANVKLVGEFANDNSGWNLASQGDLNHDGNDDLLIGLRQNASGNVAVGYVFFGPLTTKSISLSNASIKVVRQIQSINENVESSFVFGTFNSDTISDILIGSCSTNSGTNDPGEISLLFGKTL